MTDRHGDTLQADAGGVTVTTSVPGVAEVLVALRADGVAAALAGGDPSLWGQQARSEAEKRLGWLSAASTSRELLPRLHALRDALRAEGVTEVVLCGMGGSSLAPEVITAAAGVPLTVLDATDPGQVRDALERDLARTVVVVSSKSGGTVETDSQRRAFAAALGGAGIDAASRIVVVTDPGSPLAELAQAEGYREVFLADPDVGGRYSALTAFGLVPSCLAGVDVEALLDSADALAPSLGSDDGPALLLGAALGAAATAGASALVLLPGDDPHPGFGDWVEQLVAESTGKQGMGILPVVTGPGPGGGASFVAPAAADAHRVRTGATAPTAPDGAPAGPDGFAGLVAGPLGGLFLAWEFATAVAGRVLGINPFDQPDVESAKTAARGMLDDRPEPEPALFTDGTVEVRGSAGLLDDVDSLTGALSTLTAAIGPGGYLAVMAYLDRTADARAEALQPALAGRVERPVTFGWGPRFLHSTGQLHKGGPPVGVFLQLTGAVTTDQGVPGQEFTFGELLASQAAGDAAVLAEHGRPVLRLHLTDRSAGLAQILEALG